MSDSLCTCPATYAGFGFDYQLQKSLKIDIQRSEPSNVLPSAATVKIPDACEAAINKELNQCFQVIKITSKASNAKIASYDVRHAC